MVIRKKRGGRQKPAEDLAHHGFYPYLKSYLEAMELNGSTPGALRRKDNHIRRFMRWSDERELHDPTLITKPILERYRRYLFTYRKPDGTPLGLSTQHVLLTGIKVFFKWLTKENYLLYNPASELELPRRPRRLPRVILNNDEIEMIMNQPDIKTVEGLRDRAILEVLYSTGIRRMEITNLCLSDLDARYGTLFVREGKGGKDRLIPIGERALAWVNRYLQDSRTELMLDIDEDALFITDYGTAFKGDAIAARVKRCMERADVHKIGSCHLFRHAMATHMLNNGADIRFIQAMLGHSQLSTTEIYTHVSIEKLKAIHKATHPARLTRTQTKNEIDQQTETALLTLLAEEELEEHDLDTVE